MSKVMRSRRIDCDYAYSNKEEQIIPSLIRVNNIGTQKQTSKDNTVPEEDVDIRTIEKEIVGAPIR